MNPGEAARAAIALSVPVGERLRAAAGKGDVLTLRNQVRQLFATEAERVEAIRLLDLVVWSRRRRDKNGANQTETEPYT